MTVTKQNKHIEIVISLLSGLNIMTPESSNEVSNILKKYFTDVGITVIKEEVDLENLIKEKPDLVFLGVKYVGFTADTTRRESPDKIWLSEYLESNGVNHTASKAIALKLEFNKILAKEVMQRNNINTAPFFIAKPGQYKNNEELPLRFPLFIKPVYEGNGKGIDQDSIVANFAAFEKKVESIYEEFRGSSLIETYLSGREFTVGIFGAISNEWETAMPVEIKASDNYGNKILSFEVKTEDNERLIPIQDAEEHKRISEFAKKAFIALGARDYGRIDIRMDENGVLFFLEANLLPGLNPRKSYFIKTCKINNQAGYEEAILRIVETALERSN